MRVNAQRGTKEMKRVDGGHLLTVLKETDVRTDAANFSGKGFLGQSGLFSIEAQGLTKGCRKVREFFHLGIVGNMACYFTEALLW